ncbi:MAG: hypothetical protein DI603_02075 [Roseateles depolymerans]|uniref:Ankyrin repeat domain-containing protein n=1 Tax=Roseateles depolymerans TaxID=76731 RepID=A0A2W5FUK3_9BURK|nr:MAG: hypothetical protein DI603_02075 [Roseateles depolymerans]
MAPISSRLLLAAFAACFTLHAQSQPTSDPKTASPDLSVQDQVRSLGAATQANADGNWDSQRNAEKKVAATISALIAKAPGQPALTARDDLWRTPLINAALWGYADVVAALLADDSVRASINEVDGQGLSAWMAAQMAQPLTLASCHPQMLVREAVGLWGPNLQRMAYFSPSSGLAFARIRAMLGAAGAKPDLDAAKAQWNQRCPGQAEATVAAVAASEDLLQTLLQDSGGQITAFLNAQKETPKSVVPKVAPPQPTLPRLKLSLPLSLAQTAISAGQSAMVCAAMPKPDAAVLEGLQLASGSAKFLYETTTEVRDGRPVAVRLDLKESSDRMPPASHMRLRAAVYQALGSYRCPGDHIFVQEFQFTVR